MGERIQVIDEFLSQWINHEPSGSLPIVNSNEDTILDYDNEARYWIFQNE